MKVLNWVWRLLATGHCFSFLFTGGFILAVTALPLVRLYPGSAHDKDRRARRVIHHVFRFYIWQMQKLGVITLDMKHTERLRKAGGKLVIANHPSLLDVVLLISLMPECSCVVKGSLRRSLVSGVIRATGYIGNDNGEAMLARCSQALAQGDPVIVFPEGTRTTPGQALVFQRGAANIAVRCGADIVPVVITCDPPTLLKGEQWYKIPARRPHFTVEVREPLRLADLVGEETAASRATRQLNRRLLDYYEGILTHG